MLLPITILPPAATSSVRLSSSLSLPFPCLSHQASELTLVPETSQTLPSTFRCEMGSVGIDDC